MEYDVALIEKEGVSGLKLEEIKLLYGFCTNPHMNGREEVFPVELEAKDVESTALGFIRKDAYEELNWDLEGSGLHDFIASIMDDMNLEEQLSVTSYVNNGQTYRTYEFKGLKIWLNRY